MRLLGFFGHRHAWTTAFTVWLEPKNAEPEIVYQSFDWFDEPTYVYNSATMNPAPAPDKGFDGGHTGLLNAKAGDRLHFNCHIEYTEERAIQENSRSNQRKTGRCVSRTKPSLRRCAFFSANHWATWVPSSNLDRLLTLQSATSGRLHVRFRRPAPPSCVPCVRYPPALAQG
jgi:hypothetical protein